MALKTWTNLSKKALTDMQVFQCKAVVRENTALTTNYVDTDHVDVGMYSYVGVMINATKGGLTSIQYKIYQSMDASAWYREPTESVLAGSIEHTLAEYIFTLGTENDLFFIVQNCSKYMKLAIKGTGTPTGSSCSITIIGVR